MNRVLIVAGVLLLAGCVSAPKPLRGDYAAVGPRDALQADRLDVLADAGYSNGAQARLCKNSCSGWM